MGRETLTRHYHPDRRAIFTVIVNTPSSILAQAGRTAAGRPAIKRTRLFSESHGHAVIPPSPTAGWFLLGPRFICRGWRCLATVPSFGLPPS